MLYLGLIFSVISLLCVVDHTALSASTKENGVIQLTPENFEETLKQSANLLVVYIAPWCGHCKTLMPDLMRVATRLKHKKVNAQVGTLDASVYPKFAERRDITGFPTLLLYKYGVFSGEYLGERSDRLLTKFISTKAEMSGVTKLNSLRDLLAFCSVSVGSDVDVEVDVNGDVIEGLLDSEYESGLGLDKDTLNDYVNEFDTISLVLGLFPKPKGDGTSSKTDAAKSMDAIGVESRNGELPSEEELIAMGGRKAPGISSNTSFVDSVYNASPGVVTTPGRSKAEEAFLTVAYNYQSGRFATTDDEWLCKHFDVSENTIIAFGDGSVNANAQVIAKMTLTASTPSNEPQDVDERDATQLALFEEMHEKIVAFLATHSMPLVTVFSPETLGLIETSVLKVHVLLFLDENTEHASILRPGMASVAKLYRGSALFIEVPATEHQVLNAFQIKEDNFPQVVIADMRNESVMRRYRLTYEVLNNTRMDEIASDETLSEQEQLEAALECLVDSIDKFIKDFFDGRLTPTFFSAPPIPEEPEPGPDGTRPSIPVNYGRSISGNQFTEVVMKSDSHVLLYVYAPWCSYCKAFDSVYLELVAYFKHENNRLKNTIIARMDGTLNEIDHDAVRIVGYPTVIFFPINNKDFPVEYEGNRNFDDIVRFISDFSQ